MCWHSRRFFFSAKMTSLEIFDMYLVICDINSQYLIKFGQYFVKFGQNWCPGGWWVGKSMSLNLIPATTQSIDHQHLLSPFSWRRLRLELHGQKLWFGSKISLRHVHISSNPSFGTKARVRLDAQDHKHGPKHMRPHAFLSKPLVTNVNFPRFCWKGGCFAGLQKERLYFCYVWNPTGLRSTPVFSLTRAIPIPLSSGFTSFHNGPLLDKLLPDSNGT